MTTSGAWWKQEPFASIIGDVSKGKGVAEATGPGPDGKVNPQRQAPVGIMNTSQGSKMLHEGEVKLTTNDGKFAVIPSHALSSDVLKMMEEKSKMGGFANGGTGQTDNLLTNGKKTATTNPIIQNTIPTSPLLAPQTTNNSAATINPIPTMSSPAKTPAGTPATPESDINLSSSIIRNYATGKPSAAANQATQNQGGAAAAGSMALAQKAAMSGLSPQQQQTESAVNQRDNTNSMAQLQGSLAATAQNLQLTSAEQLNSMAIAQRNYDDATVSRAVQDIASGAATDYATYKTLNPNSTMDEATFNNLFSVNSPTLTTGYNTLKATLNSDMAQAQSTTDPTLKAQFIADAQSVWKQMSDPKYGALNAGTQQPIWNALTAPSQPLINAINTYLDSGAIDSKYLNDPAFKNDFTKDVQEAYTTGGATVDSNGNLVMTKDFAMPWENSSTFFNYTDWNGNPIPAGTDPTSETYLSQTVKNQDGTVAKDASGKDITYADMEAKWNSLGAVAQSKYFDATKGVGKQFDLSGFLNSSDGFGTLGGGKIQLQPMSVFTTELTGSDTYSNALRASETNIGSMVPKDKNGVAVGYNYYDSAGNLKTGADALRPGTPEFNLVYAQWNKYMNGGNTPSSDSEQRFLSWLASDSGKAKIQLNTNDSDPTHVGEVMNFSDAGTTGASASNSYQVDSKYADTISNSAYLGQAALSGTLYTTASNAGFLETGDPASEMTDDTATWAGKLKSDGEGALVIGGNSLTVTGYNIGGTGAGQTASISFTDSKGGNGSLVFDPRKGTMYYAAGDPDGQRVTVNSQGIITIG